MVIRGKESPIRIDGPARAEHARSPWRDTTPRGGRRIGTRSEVVQPFGRSSFLDAWWRHLAPGWLSPVVSWEGGAEFGRAGLSVAAGMGAADYATPRWSPERESQLDRLAGTGLILPRVLKGSELHRWCASRQSLTVPYDVAPVLDLSVGWEAIAQRRSSRTWSSFRRKERRLTAEGETSFIHIHDREGLRNWLPKALSIYASRAATVRRGLLWTSPRGQAFLRTWMSGLADEGALDLAFLLVDGRPEAFTFVIGDADTHYLYGLAFDPHSRLAKWSPGEQLLVHVMQRAAEVGAREFDFLVGDEPYKRAWADRLRPVEAHFLAPSALGRHALAAWPRLKQRLRMARHRAEEAV